MRIRQEEVVWRELDDRLVLLDLRSSQYYEINGTGAVLLRHLVNDVTQDSLVQLLSETYQLSMADATADVTAFIDHLSSHQLLDQS